MAKDLTPDAWISSWSENGTNITIPIASIPTLVDTEVDTVTGSITKFLFKFLEKLYTVQEALPDADKPDQMTIVRSQLQNTSTSYVEFRVRVYLATATVTFPADT
jgi:hypothetical protein